MGLPKKFGIKPTLITPYWDITTTDIATIYGDLDLQWINGS
jgi:hypothetical protein